MHLTSHTRRDLTAHYCLYQVAYYASCAGYSAFAVSYLLGKGFSSSEIGVILALTSIFSCVLQPVLGDYADRRPVSALQRLLAGCIGVTFACAALIEGIALGHALTGALYLLGGVTFSLTVALCNALCASYAHRQYTVNYGAGSGVGSVSFSFASLAMGYVIARLGARVMMMFVLLFLACQAALVLSFPRIKDTPGSDGTNKQASLSLIAFARRYKYFMLTLLGVMLLAACHMMAENFMIHLFTEFGGGSENVGTALFIACMTAAPFQLLFEKIQTKFSVDRMLRVCGIFYVLKASLMIFASSTMAVYLIELLQTFTFVFLFPPLYYLSRSRIAEADIAKGQTVANALYTLGVAIGNSLGGAVIDFAGVRAMLALAALLAFMGAVIINMFIGKKDV